MSKVDTALEALTVALLVWLPLAFGGVLPSSHLVIVVTGLLMAVLLGVRAMLAGEVVCPWATVPLVAMVALVFLQLVELPISLLSGLSPSTATTWSALVTDPAGAGATHGTLSLYPQGTAEDARLLVVGVILFLVAVTIYRDPARLRRLLGGMAILGAVVAAVGLLQNVAGAPGIYWVEGWGNNNPTAGPFRHYGHFSQFVNMTMGCGLALLFLRLGYRTGRRRFEAPELFADLGAPERKGDRLVVGFLVLAMVAIAMSRSRNGMISMVVAGAVIAGLMHFTRYARGLGWPMLGLVAVAFGVLLFLGFDPVYERLATLGAGEDAYSGRLAILSDTMGMVGEYPVWGTGQGAFEYTFPVFDTSQRPGRAEHAENQYAEILAETGVLGALLAISVFVLVGWSLSRRLRSDSRTPMDAARFGLAFGWVAVSFHATTDFGLRIPAVAALFVVVLGLLSSGCAPVWRGGRGKVIGGVLGFGGALVLLMQVSSAYAAWDADGHWHKAEAILEGLPELEADVAFDKLLSEMDQRTGELKLAVEAQPGNVEYRLAAALSQWDRAMVEALGETPPEEERSPATAPELVAVAQRVQDELLDARKVCPTYGLLWSMAGQLGALWLDNPAAASWIERGLDYAPQNPGVCLSAARHHLRRDDVDASVAMFRRSVRMGAGIASVVDTLIYDLQRPDVAREVVRGDPGGLSSLESKLARIPGTEALRADIRAEARETLEKLVAGPDARPWMFGAIANFAMASETPEEDAVAVSFFRRYLGRVPGDAQRLRLAIVLHRQGEVQAARQELQKMLRFHPSGSVFRRVKALQEKWATDTDKVPAESAVSGESPGK